MSSSVSTESLQRLAKNLATLNGRIESAALRYRRNPDAVGLVAVSKQQTADAVRVVAGLGQRQFGESYLQEALPKIGALADLDLIWHFIGQIQSNKTRSIAEHFQWVHTVDRLKVAERLSEQRSPHAAPLNVCIQVKLAEEEGKGGVIPQDAVSLARAIEPLPRLRLRGLMCIPPPAEAFDRQLHFFEQAAQLLTKLRETGLAVDTLSMGMSTDLEAAVAAGATLVRVGTAIFGERKK